MNDFVLFNGVVQSNEEVRVSPLNRGMMYGDGCFETLQSFSGKFLAFDAHFQRLSDAYDYLNMELPFTEKELNAMIHRLLDANNLKERQVMIRFQSWRKGERGYKTESRATDWMITASRLGKFETKPLQLITAQTPVIPSRALHRSMKLSNGLNYIMAAQEAHAHNADDAVMLTLNGSISETTISNLFWAKGNTLCTPSVDCDLLPGVTRNLVINVLQNSEFELKEGIFYPDDLKSAEFAFTTNSISEIRSVLRIDDQTFVTRHPKFIQIKEMFEAYKQESLR